MGPHSFFFPIEQEPHGLGLRPPPALVTLDVVPSTQPGYRAVLRDVPAESYLFYRTGLPDFKVQVMQTLGNGEEFAPFDGSVKCRLTTAVGTVVLERLCTPDTGFPWPSQLPDDTYDAEVLAISDEQTVVAEPYRVRFTTHLDPQQLTVTSTGTGQGTVTSAPAGIDCGATCSSHYAWGAADHRHSGQSR